MKISTIIATILILTLPSNNSKLEGRWKMVQFDPFEIVLNSPDYLLGDENTKKEFERTINFTLNNTIYEFRGDTIYMTDYIRDKIVTKKGIFFQEGDKLNINYLDKIASTAFRLISVTDNELILELVYREIPNNIYARFEKIPNR